MWVYALAGGTVFSSHLVPGPRSTVNPMLSRLASEPERTLIERVHRGLYYKRRGPHWPFSMDWAANLRSVFWIAGPGAGLTGYSALNRLGWARQVPNATYMVVAGRVPAVPGLPHVRWERIAGAPHRMELNPGECSVIEAVRWWISFGAPTWDWVLQETAYNEPECQFWRTLEAVDVTIRPDALHWAADKERPTHLEESAWADDPIKPEHTLEERIHHIANAAAIHYAEIGVDP